jgi:hypothetical protein
VNTFNNNTFLLLRIHSINTKQKGVLLPFGQVLVPPQQPEVVGKNFSDLIV